MTFATYDMLPTLSPLGVSDQSSQPVANAENRSFRYTVFMQFQTMPTREELTWSADEPRLIDLSKFIVRPDPLPVIEA